MMRRMKAIMTVTLLAMTLILAQKGTSAMETKATTTVRRRLYLVMMVCRNQQQSLNQKRSIINLSCQTSM